MAGTSERTSIADDWQEIDASSPVQSVPSSDDEDDLVDDVIELSSTASLSPPPYQTPRISAFAAPEPAVVASTDTESSPHADSSGPSPIDVPASGIDNASITLPSSHIDDSSQTLSTREPSNQSPEIIDPRTQTRSEAITIASPGRHNDPAFCHTTLQAVIDGLAKTTHYAEQIADPNPFYLVDMVQTLKALLQQSQELEPILDAYAQHWRAHGSGMAAGEMPLNASTLDWITAVRDRLADLDADLWRASSWWTGDAPRLTTDLGRRHLEPLDELRRGMDEFLPILKTDFSEFQTGFMSFPVHYQDADAARAPRSRSNMPNPLVAEIRHELYDLKDEIREAMVIMDGFYATDPPPPIPGVPAMISSLNAVISAIATTLTNNNMDWIEDNAANLDFAPAMSFPDFVSLDPGVLRDVKSHFVAFCAEMDPRSLAEADYRITPEIIRNHQAVSLVEGGLMQELMSVAEFLQSLLTPGGEPPARSE